MKRVLALVVFACGPVSEREDVARSEQAIVRGEPSSAEDDAVVLVARWSEKGSFYQCSGVALAARVVLTARHCVEGRPASAIGVYTRRDAWSKLVRREHAAIGARVFASAEYDAAAIVLDVDLDVPTAPVRMDRSVRPGEVVDVVGFGVDEGGTSPAVRHRRRVPVLAVGPLTTRIGDRVLAGEFVLGEAACSGDSGGPAIAETGAVVGIASRVGNGTRDPGPAFCLGDDAHDVYVGTRALAPLLEDAFRAAGASPERETMAAELPVEPADRRGCR